MTGKKIMMLVMNTHDHDSRVERSAKALLDAGAEVVLVCLGLPGQNASVEKSRHQLGYEMWRVNAELRGGIAQNSALSDLTKTNALATKKKSIFKSSSLIWLFAPWLLIPSAIRRPIVHALNSNAATQKPLNALRKWQKKVWQIIFLIGKIRNLDSLTGANILRAILSAEFKARQESYFRFAKAALGLARKMNPDFVHAHDFNTLPAARLIFDRLKIPFAYDSHELWVDRNRGKTPITYEEKIWEIHYERESIKMAAGSITVCQKIAEHLSLFHGVEAPTVIRNTPYRNQFRAGENSLRTKLMLSDQDVIGLYVGKITYNRGVMGILDALPQVPSNLKFVLLGYFDANFKIEFWRRVQELNLQNRVFHFGPVPTNEVASWASSADFSIVSMDPICLSYFYTLPNKFFESVQAGLPIMACRLPELENHVNKYKCGILFDNYNHDSLVGSLQKVTIDKEFRTNIKQNAIVAVEELCWERESEKLLDFYQTKMISYMGQRNTSIVPDAELTGRV